MHNVLFVLAWPLAIICPLTPKKWLLPGAMLFLAWQLCLWHFTFSAMSSPDWDDSVGDAFVPFVISLPLVLFFFLIAVRGLFTLFNRAIERRHTHGPAA